MPDLRTCLWFSEGGEDAVAFCTQLLPDSRIDGMDRPGPDAPPILIRFTLTGAPCSAPCAAGGPAPTHAASIAVELDQTEADCNYDAILARGGAEVQCGWVTDARGVSWRIVPRGNARRALRRRRRRARRRLNGEAKWLVSTDSRPQCLWTRRMPFLPTPPSRAMSSARTTL